MGSQVMRHLLWLSLRNRYPRKNHLRGLRRDGESSALRGGWGSIRDRCESRKRTRSMVTKD